MVGHDRGGCDSVDTRQNTACLDVFHDHVDVLGRLNDLIQAYDVRVVEQSQDLDLAPHCAECMRPVRAPFKVTRTFLLHVELLDLPLVEDLDGNLLVGQHVLRHLDLRSLGDQQRNASSCTDNTLPNEPIPRVLPIR